jgi:tetratricopeptide (TPR) repeat protein
MQTTKTVKVWEEQVTIPTYKVFQAEKSPLFIEKRAYQGSTGKVYPFPVTEKISDEKEDVSYRAIFLENDYLQVMILPELGGRIQRALDKTNQYDFVYYNHVIKPALVGLTGPWISGGIEFNWPQHHRPSTFSPVDYKYTENKDGSCTVYVSEIDRMYGTKGMGAFTLYPDKAYIEIKGQLFNRTDTPQTFLWWANPAVPVNEHTYSVFPPDVHAVMDHGKRAVSTFPIATGEYYKYDYSAGIDISRYKNIKVPTSYMAAHSDFDFIGNYDEKIEAGLLHVADHHISPGKKQWTWGNSDFGLAWDRNLTETDGPYIELMTGVFTDNQPDFTWLKPYEEKTFTQYFMPYKGVGRVKNATKDAMINYEILDGKAYIKLYTSGSYQEAEIKVSYEGKTLFCEKVDITPLTSYETSFDTTIATPAGCIVTVTDLEGVILVQYKAVEKKLMPTPDPAQPLLPPAQLKSTEELYLGALHLEQYRHATYEPADYYEEGLRRDASDIRLNNGYGMLQFKRGNIQKAIQHFEKAIEKQTWKNPNPYYGESYFNLGLALEMAGEDAKAYDAFYKSTWSYETQSGGFYWLACLSSRKQQYTEALEFVDKSLIYNWHNMKARCLKAAILRLLRKDNTRFLQESIDIDPLYMGCLYEQAILQNDFDSWKKIMRGHAHNYLELSIDYLIYGLYEDAIQILEICGDKTPLVYYYQGYAYTLAGDMVKAVERYRLGEATNSDYCFPNKVIEINILKSAITALGKAPFAHYYLGNLFYDKKQYEAAANHWEISYAENDSFAMTCRNLAIYYYNKLGDVNKAIVYMKKAYDLEPDCARFVLEYDQLRARAGVSNEVRLDFLEGQLDIVKTRDALYLEYITLLNSTGQYDKALDCLLSHTFHPWEGGEGKVSNQYRLALTEKAIQELDLGNMEKAIELLKSTITYPNNLGEGKLPNTQDNIANYYLGKAYNLMGDQNKATEYYKKASIGLEEPSSVLYYNDQPSDTILYQGLANEALGNADAARKSYHQLLAFGEKHLFDKVDYDYFAVSLPEIEVFPDNIQLRNDTYCNYLIGLGYLGLGKLEKAGSFFDKILEEQPNYQGVIRHKKMLKQLTQ